MNQQPIHSNQGINLIKQARAVLTDNMIKALPTTSITVAPAPGLGKIIVANPNLGPGNAVLTLIQVADYTNINAGAVIAFGIPPGGYSSFSLNSFFNWGAPGTVIYAPSMDLYNNGSPFVNDSYLMENSPLNISFNNQGDGDLEDGDPSNILIVTVPYLIFNITTGLFE